MKIIGLYFFLFAYSPVIYSQTNSQHIKKSISSKDYIRWDLNKYLWGYARVNTQKYNKPSLDFEAIDNWQGMSNSLAVSNNGSYFAYGIESGCGLPDDYKKQDSLILQATNGSWHRSFTGVQPGFFAA